MNRPPGFNSKARRSVAGGSRKKGKPKRKTGLLSATEVAPDPNGDIITPKTQEQKDLERQARIDEEAQVDTRESKRKRRRSEKYVDAMLKKENRVQLLKNLAQTQATISTSGLQSSATLGSGRLRTHEQLAEKAEHHAVQKAIGGGRRHKRGRVAVDINDDDDMFDSASGSSADESPSKAGSEAGMITPTPPAQANHAPVNGTESVIPTTASSAVSAVVSVGSGLKRNADGTVNVPQVIPQKTKGAKTQFSAWGRQKTVLKPESDTSFDSSDSENDTDEDNAEHSSAEEDEEWGGITAGDAQGLEQGLQNPVNDVWNGSDDDNSTDDGPMSSTESSIQPKNLGGFKKWAMQQLSAAKEYVAPPRDDDRSPTPPLALPPTKRVKTTHPTPSDGLIRGPLGHTLEIPSTSLAKHLDSEKSKQQTTQIQVNRPLDVQATRLELPIVAEEQQIMEAITLNPVVIICGETGSGKTTQVPQFLYEAGYSNPGGDNPGMIGITQPRRVAAMAMAERVSYELALPPSRVSYHIRYDTTTSPTTTIKFMTDGVLLRELASDFLLTKYSVIIIDEAHERSLNTDILLGVLSRVVNLRMERWDKKEEGAKPLRLIIMSATLRVSDFAQNSTLFSTPPPVISVNARQHPVTVHFARRTDSDYVGAAVKKACKIHTRLPPGGILIFLTGQNEISGVIRKLESRYGARALEDRKRRHTSRTVHDDMEGARVTTSALVSIEAEDMELGDKVEDLAADVDHVDAEDILIDEEDLESEPEDSVSIDVDENFETPMHIVPLYSLLPRDKQMKAFEAPPEGSRLVVVATNVAETSVTIPGIRYVVDCGRAKERRYEVDNGIQAFQVSWISKASAAQRAGRAGRTGPGHCYRLYSSPVFEHYFDEFSAPEISRVPIEGVVLQMKAMHIDAVTGFPFPTPPDRIALRKAEKTLVLLRALDPTSKSITELGKGMALFPLSPRYSRMLVSGRQKGCLPYVIAIVSALSVGDPFIREVDLGVDEGEINADDLAHLTNEAVRAKEARSARRKAFFQNQHLHGSLGDFTSDVFRVLSVVGAYEFAKGGHAFCNDHFVRPKAMEEIHKLRGQISNIVETNFSGVPANFTHSLPPPDALQLKILRQLIASAFIDQVAVRKDRVSATADSGNQYATAHNVPYRAMDIEEDLYIHPSSLLATQVPPEYVVFSEVVRTSRVWMKGLTVVNPAWLSALGKPTLCTFSKPVKNAAGQMMVIPHFGPGWELPAIPAEKM